MLGPQWRALQREAQVAAEQLAQGATLLRKAHFSQPGRYLQAFFCLSIGFERTGKLIYVADYAIKNFGKFPTDEELRSLGHDVAKLLNTVEIIGNQLNDGRLFSPRPDTPIHKNIIHILTLFAKQLRYYNLSYITGTTSGDNDPLKLWWNTVSEEILKKHYGARKMTKDLIDAEAIDAILKDTTTVLSHSEVGDEISTVREYYQRTYATTIAQNYGQLYTLQLIRWLASIIDSLSHAGAYEHRIEALIGLEEPYRIFMNFDKLLKKKRTWSTFDL